ncbi:hypothetical protein [Pseudoxanthomonas winnipegensis]|uniref:hypothetical protein n=1 Tax=Pseudoxanthomonas winnipegensis TaxID=2480810 RepID=UPI0010DC3F37|nr:hypothetical protein [Pseudoxanthomonas winnipegensis]TBV78035.1 hypothetical protein EYC46_03400 [Pseudoxanthomonas winnipegensis]
MNQCDPDLLAALPELSDDEKHQRILLGLADAEAGRLIPHETVILWAASLLDSGDTKNGTKYGGLTSGWSRGRNAADQYW